MKIKLTESKLKQIVTESVKKVINEHHWDDMDFDEEDYGKIVDHIPNKEDDFYGGMSDVVRRLKYAVSMNPNSCNWDDDKSSYYAGMILLQMDKQEKVFQDMDITPEDIYYLWRKDNEKRLKSIYNINFKEYYKALTPEKTPTFRGYQSSKFDLEDNQDYALGFNRHNIDIDRNLNIYDNGLSGEAALYAQDDEDKEAQRIARNLSTTMRNTKQNYEKNK
jgi:hypothetical protein